MNENTLGEWDTSPIPPNHLLEIGDNLIVRIIIRDDELNSTFNINNNTNDSNSNNTVDSDDSNEPNSSEESFLNLSRARIIVKLTVLLCCELLVCI